MVLFWGAAVSGLLSAGSSLLGSRMSSKQAKRQYAYSVKLADHQFDLNRQMWELQNQYNTPENQMLRYKQAGLNPNLIYGQGTPGNATEMPQYQAPALNMRYKTPDFSGVIPAYQDAKVKQAQTDNVNEQTNLMIAQRATELSKNLKTLSEKDKVKLEAEILEATKGSIRDLKAAEVQGKLLQNNLLHSQRKTENEKRLKIITERIFLSHQNKLAEKGIFKNDSIILREIAKYLQNMGISPAGASPELIESLSNKALREIKNYPKWLKEKIRKDWNLLTTPWYKKGGGGSGW